MVLLSSLKLNTLSITSCNWPSSPLVLLTYFIFSNIFAIFMILSSLFLISALKRAVYLCNSSSKNCLYWMDYYLVLVTAAAMADRVYSSLISKVSECYYPALQYFSMSWSYLFLASWDSFKNYFSISSLFISKAWYFFVNYTISFSSFYDFLVRMMFLF